MAKAKATPANNAPPAQDGNQPVQTAADAAHKANSVATPDTPPAASSTLPGALDGTGLEIAHLLDSALSLEPIEPRTAPPVAGGMGWTITSKREGFRRAGRAWSTTPTPINRDDFSAEQFAALMQEPMLLIAQV